MGCTPLVNAIKSDDLCHNGRERLAKAMKKEERMNALLNTPTSSKQIPNSTTCTTTTPVSPSRANNLMNPKKLKTSNPVSNSDKENVTMETDTNQNTPLAVPPTGRSSLTPCAPESLDARKLRQAQRKEEWQKRHKQTSKTDNKEEKNVVSNRGGDPLITDGKLIMVCVIIEFYLSVIFRRSCFLG